MNRVEPIPVSSGDDARLDAWLAAYFKGEMPDPWPTFQPPRRDHLLPRLLGVDRTCVPPSP